MLLAEMLLTPELGCFCQWQEGVECLQLVPCVSRKPPVHLVLEHTELLETADSWGVEGHTAKL